VTNEKTQDLKIRVDYLEAHIDSLANENIALTQQKVSHYSQMQQLRLENSRLATLVEQGQEHIASLSNTNNNIALKWAKQQLQASGVNPTRVESIMTQLKVELEIYNLIYLKNASPDDLAAASAVRNKILGGMPSDNLRDAHMMEIVNALALARKENHELGLLQTTIKDLTNKKTELEQQVQFYSNEFFHLNKNIEKLTMSKIVNEETVKGLKNEIQSLKSNPSSMENSFNDGSLDKIEVEQTSGKEIINIKNLLRVYLALFEEITLPSTKKETVDTCIKRWKKEVEQHKSASAYIERLASQVPTQAANQSMKPSNNSSLNSTAASNRSSPKTVFEYLIAQDENQHSQRLFGEDSETDQKDATKIECIDNENQHLFLSFNLKSGKESDNHLVWIEYDVLSQHCNWKLLREVDNYPKPHKIGKKLRDMLLNEDERDLIESRLMSRNNESEQPKLPKQFAKIIVDKLAEVDYSIVSFDKVHHNELVDPDKFDSSQIFGDEILNSKLVHNNFIEEEYSVDLSRDLRMSIGNNHHSLQSTEDVHVLKSKIAELESNIREVKEKEKKMIIDLSKDRVISEYEKRMKEMAEKIETLKTNLESSERNSWQSQSVQPTLISSPSKQNLGMVETKYYNDYNNQMRFNSNIKWFSCRLFCYSLVTAPVKDKKGGVKSFLSGGLIHGQDCFFFSFETGYTSKFALKDSCKRAAQDMVVDVCCFDSFNVVAQGRTLDSNSISIVYHGHTNEYKLENRFKPFFFISEARERFLNYNNILKRSKDEYLYFISRENTIIKALVQPNSFGKVSTYIKETVLPVAFTQGDIPQLIEIGEYTLFIATEQGSLIKYELKTGKEKRVDLDLGIITAMRIRDDRLVFATKKKKDNDNYEIGLHVVDTKLNMLASRPIPKLTDHIKIIRIVYMKVQNVCRIILMVVPNTADATVMAYDLSDQGGLLHISTKTDWWPRRRINGICQFGHQLLVFGENSDLTQTDSELSTVAMISF
jgi:hypothetical protein